MASFQIYNALDIIVIVIIQSMAVLQSNNLREINYHKIKLYSLKFLEQSYYFEESQGYFTIATIALIQIKRFHLVSCLDYSFKKPLGT